MDNGQNVNAPRLDRRERTKSHSDIITRRLKNRERQRRYRARKRLEADINKTCVVNQSTPQQEELQLNGILTNCSRVHCKRDWKKDARSHASKQAVIANDPVIPALTLASESQAPFLPSGMRAEPPPPESELDSEKPSSLDNLETGRTTLGRRDWKADARNKK